MESLIGKIHSVHSGVKCVQKSERNTDRLRNDVVLRIKSDQVQIMLGKTEEVRMRDSVNGRNRAFFYVLHLQTHL